MKIADINKIIRELWAMTYSGEDIDMIEIVSGDDEDSGKAKRCVRLAVVGLVLWSSPWCGLLPLSFGFDVVSAPWYVRVACVVLRVRSMYRSCRGRRTRQLIGCLFCWVFGVAEHLHCAPCFSAKLRMYDNLLQSKSYRNDGDKG